MEEPGTALPLYLLDENTGDLIDTGTTAIVDETGLKATGEVSHFSKFVVAKKVMPNYKIEKKAGFCVEMPNYNLYGILPPPDLDLLEGLSVPVVIEKRLGSPGGVGPFPQNGLDISGSTDDGTPISVGPLIHML